MHGRHFSFEDLAFVVHWLHFFAANNIFKALCSTAGIFCVVCGLHVQNRSVCKQKKWSL